MNKFDYSAISKFCLENHQETVTHILCLADQICDNIFIFDRPWDMERTITPAVFTNKKIDWLHCPTGDNEFIWQFNRHRFFIILAQAYWLTNNDKYAENFVRIISDWIDNAHLSSDKSLRYTWRSLEIGLRCEYWTKALKMLDGAPALTDIVKDKIKKSLFEQAEVLYQTHNAFRKSSNWGVIQDHGLYAVSMFYKGDIDDKYHKTALERLEQQSLNQLMTDGVHWEQSCMYHTEVLVCLMDTITNAKHYNDVIPQQIVDNAKRMLKVILAWKRPDHTHPIMGDSDNSDVRDILTFGAYLFGDSTLKFGGFPILDFESVWIFGSKAINAYADMPSSPPCWTSIALEDSGNFFMRESYDEDSNYLHFITGYTGGGHGHADKLHFDLSINGDNVLTDSGRYTYVPCKKRMALKSCKYHNTTIVGNRGFVLNAPSGWSYLSLAPSITQSMVVTPTAELVRGGHLGYMKIFGSTYSQRKILWIKPDLYIILDDFSSKIPHKYTQFFNFDSDIEVSLKKNTATCVGKKSITKMIFLTPNIKVSKHSTEMSPHYNKLTPNTRLIAKFRGYSGGHGVTIIYGKSNSENCNISAKLITLYNGNNMPILRRNAEGIEIDTPQGKYTIFVVRKEIMSWTQTKDGKLGARGQLVIFREGDRLPQIIHW